MRFWMVVMSLIVTVAVAANASAKDKDKKGSKEGKGAKPTVEERFQKIDTNHNGTVSQDEFVAAHPKMGADKAKKLFEKMGGTKDKGLTLAQFKKATAEREKARVEHKKTDCKKADGKKTDGKKTEHKKKAESK